MNKCKCCDVELQINNSTEYDVCIDCYREPGKGCKKCGKVLTGICYEYVCGDCIRLNAI